MDEGTLLSFTAQATDSGLPEQTLSFSLDAGAPLGASIDASTGLFTWTPTEAQGPGVYPVTIRVTDNGSPILSDSETIQITVGEVNIAPILASIGDKTVTENTLLTFTATATDPDLPAQSLTFSLIDAPAGAAIDPASGVFTWIPTVSQSGKTYQLTVRMTDGGSPPLTDEETINIRVLVPPEPYAIFAGEANLPVGSKVINWGGNDNRVTGKIHSNSDIEASGNKHVFSHSSIENVTGVTPSPDFKGKVTLDDSHIVASVVKPYPVSYELAEFAPGVPRRWKHKPRASTFMFRPTLV